MIVLDHQGISVLPITSLALDHAALRERIPSNIPRLDAMLGGQGYFRGSLGGEGVIAVDPMSSFSELGNSREVKAMLTRLVDFLTTKGITLLLTSLTHNDHPRFTP